MTVPSDPPASVTPAAFKTWAQNVSDTAQDHETRVDALESATSTPGVNAGVSGHYFAASSGATSTGTPALGLLTAHPIPVSGTVTIDRIGIEVTTAAASSFVRLGIYEDDDGKPGALLVDSGQLDASTTGVKEATVSVALTGGAVWLAHVNQGATAVTVRRQNNVLHLPSIGNATAATVSQFALSSVARTAVTGALPTPFGASAGGQTFAARVLVRVA